MNSSKFARRSVKNPSVKADKFSSKFKRLMWKYAYVKYLKAYTRISVRGGWKDAGEALNGAKGDLNINSLRNIAEQRMLSWQQKTITK